MKFNLDPLETEVRWLHALRFPGADRNRQGNARGIRMPIRDLSTAPVAQAAG